MGPDRREGCREGIARTHLYAHTYGQDCKGATPASDYIPRDKTALSLSGLAASVLRSTAECNNGSWESESPFSLFFAAYSRPRSLNPLMRVLVSRPLESKHKAAYRPLLFPTPPDKSNRVIAPLWTFVLFNFSAPSSSFTSLNPLFPTCSAALTDLRVFFLLLSLQALRLMFVRYSFFCEYPSAALPFFFLLLLVREIAPESSAVQRLFAICKQALRSLFKNQENKVCSRAPPNRI